MNPMESEIKKEETLKTLLRVAGWFEYRLVAQCLCSLFTRCKYVKIFIFVIKSKTASF